MERLKIMESILVDNVADLFMREIGFTILICDIRFIDLGGMYEGIVYC